MVMMLITIIKNNGNNSNYILISILLLSITLVVRIELITTQKKIMVITKLQ